MVQVQCRENEQAVYAVVTNCTYDGLCYNAKAVQDLLDQSVDRIHFDEAWFAYARFNPMYTNRHAMRGNPDLHDKGIPFFSVVDGELLVHSFCFIF